MDHGEISGTFLVQTVKIKPIIKAQISGKLITSGTRNVLLSAQMGERASVVLICTITSRYNELK